MRSGALARTQPARWLVHDFLGRWGEEQMQLWLRYYASDEDRVKHAREHPKDQLSPKETPLFNRDWRLPKGPF